MKKLSALAAAILCCISASAQVRIFGSITDRNTKEPLSYVNVAVYQAGSDSPLTGGFTDDDGRFTLYAPEGSYFLKATFLGYRDIEKAFSISDEDANKNLGRLVMSEDSKTIEEIEVVGQTSGMRLDIDKKVFSADQNLLSEGATASELLQNIPSVDVDTEGNVSLRNSSSVELWINGKPSGLSDTDKGEFLEMIPAESIESVELITNPSSKYDPEGNAGIINIVLKRSKKAGYYGNVSAGLQYRQGSPYPGGNLGANFAYSRDKIDLTLNANIRSRRHDRSNATYRESYAAAGDTTFMNSETHRANDRLNAFLKLGLTYHIDALNDLDFSTFGTIGQNWNSNNISYRYRYPGGDSARSRNTTGEGLMGFYSASLKYTHFFVKNVHELSFSADYFMRRRNTLNNYETRGNDPADYLFQRQTQNESGDTFSHQGDYFKLFGKDHKLEAGYKLNLAWTDSKDRTYDTEALVENGELYNPFSYFEQIYSLYANYAGKFDWFSFQAGLRGEETITRAISREDRTDRHYFKLFPSVYFSFALPKNNEIQLNYTRRIQRPRGRRINSYIDRTDPSNISYGNPLLMPEIGNVAEINYMKTWDRHTLTLGLFYRYTQDVIQQVSRLNAETDVMGTTYANITHSQNAGAEIIAKNRLFRNYLDLTTSVSAYYYQLGSNEEYDIAGSESFSWNARINANVKIVSWLSAQVNAYYNSPTIVAQGTRDHSYGIDLGLRASFLDKSLTVSFTVRDLLNSRRYNSLSTTYGSNFYQENVNTTIGRSFRLNISYNFGNMKKRFKQDRTSEEMTEEEY